MRICMNVRTSLMTHQERSSAVLLPGLASFKGLPTFYVDRSLCSYKNCMISVVRTLILLIIISLISRMTKQRILNFCNP